VTDRLRAIPPALGALLAVSSLVAVIWACLTPAFQAPDEQRHFAYVESIGTRFALPGKEGRAPISTELDRGMAAVNSNQVAAQAQVKPEWDPSVERDWEGIDAKLPDDDGGGPAPAAAYPPVSYAWQAIGYVAGSAGSLFDKLLGARLMSALWLPVTVLGTWLLAGEVLGRRRLLQTAAAAVPALLPMVAFVTASVSPDGMLYAVWTLALWLGVRCVRRAVPVVDGALFFALVGLAFTVKTTSLALLPAAAFVGVVGLLARRPWRPRRVLSLGTAAIVPLALTLGAWLVIAAVLGRPAGAQVANSSAAAAGGGGGTNWRELLSYVWQYYLPRVPGQQHFVIGAIEGGFPLLHVWIAHTWAAFGWLEVQFPLWVYQALSAVTGSVIVGSLAALWRGRRAVDLRVAGFLALAFLALLAGLHWTDYHQIKAGQGFMQGRYLFPMIGLFGLSLAAAISLLPARLRAAGTGVAVAFLLSFHILCLGLVLERFYA
jgi:4-amino-4-deoxy-L-arabinose transferase-like glycosyltransferase